jgi:hypothetical protein
MRPIHFKDASEMQCLSQNASNWSPSLNYWTGGLFEQGFSEWGWCSHEGFNQLDEGVNWAPGQPDGKLEKCLHLGIYKNNATGFALSDRNCSDKYMLACQAIALEFSIFLPPPPSEVNTLFTILLTLPIKF